MSLQKHRLVVLGYVGKDHLFIVCLFSFRLERPDGGNEISDGIDFHKDALVEFDSAAFEVLQKFFSRSGVFELDGLPAGKPQKGPKFLSDEWSERMKKE